MKKSLLFSLAALMLPVASYAAEPQLVVAIGHDESSRVEEGATVKLTSDVKGGVAPYTYSWTDASDKLLSSEDALSVIPQHSGTYFLTVKDAEGTSASARTVVLVTGKQYPATFEDIYLAPESNWHGYIDDPDYTDGFIYSGSFGFNNNYIAEWGSWNGFAVSDMTSTSYANYMTDQYNSAVGHGVGDSANYGVVFVSNWQGFTEMTLSNTTTGATAEGMWITNTAWVVDAILNGDGMEGKFEKGDWLKLTLKGIKADGSESGTLEYYLADYRSDKEADRWYLDTWQWADLKPLGDIVKVRFDIESTKKNNYGITTPTYVCIDNVGTGADVKEVAEQTLAVNEETPAAELDVAQFFSFDASEATVDYALLAANDYAALEGSTLKVEAPADAVFAVDLRATQRGCSEYVKVPIRISKKPLGIAAVSVDAAAVYPNPAVDHITVSTPNGNFAVELYSSQGIRVAATEVSDMKTRIDVSGYPAGAYIVRITDTESGAVAVRKLLIVR